MKYREGFLLAEITGSLLLLAALMTVVLFQVRIDRRAQQSVTVLSDLELVQNILSQARHYGAVEVPPDWVLEVVSLSDGYEVVLVKTAAGKRFETLRQVRQP